MNKAAQKGLASTTQKRNNTMSGKANKAQVTVATYETAEAFINVKHGERGGKGTLDTSILKEMRVTLKASKVAEALAETKMSAQVVSMIFAAACKAKGLNVHQQASIINCVTNLCYKKNGMPNAEVCAYDGHGKEQVLRVPVEVGKNHYSYCNNDINNVSTFAGEFTGNKCDSVKVANTALSVLAVSSYGKELAKALSIEKKDIEAAISARLAGK